MNASCLNALRASWALIEQFWANCKVAWSRVFLSPLDENTNSYNPPPFFSGEDDEGGEEGRLDKHTVDLLLRYGAYDMLNDTPNSESRYDEDDIDTILERAVTIKHNEEGRGGGGGLEAFAKASFCSADAAPEIELDDPDFWKKVTQTRGSSLQCNNNNNNLHKGVASRVLEKKGTCSSGTSLAPQKTRL